MIINIRGTHGSGKSTVVRALIDMSQREPTDVNKNGRPNNYRLKVPGVKRPVFVIGPYETACGGCDAIQPYDLIWPRVIEFAKKGHVVFEGALVSSGVGNIGRELSKRRNASVLFMDTPVDECIRRITKRRKARGEERPVNPKNTELKYRTCMASVCKFQELGVRTEMLSHRGSFALNRVLEVLREN